MTNNNKRWSDSALYGRTIEQEGSHHTCNQIYLVVFLLLFWYRNFVLSEMNVACLSMKERNICIYTHAHIYISVQFLHLAMCRFLVRGLSFLLDAIHICRT